jgi:hypothetical protein
MTKMMPVWTNIPERLLGAEFVLHGLWRLENGIVWEENCIGHGVGG